MLAKRAEDLRTQRYWGYRRDARFVRPHSAWVKSHTECTEYTEIFDRRTEGHIFGAGTQKSQTYTEF